jgi:hypothetical protein
LNTQENFKKTLEQFVAEKKIRITQYENLQIKIKSLERYVILIEVVVGNKEKVINKTDG